MKQNDCYEIGYITKTHGLKGEVTLELDVDEPESYTELETAFVEVKKQLVPFIIERINVQQKRAIIKFEGVNTLDEAGRLLHCKVMLPLEDLPESEDGKFYLHEVLGYTVEDEALGKLGIISQLYEGTHQDILGMEYQGKEVLIPVVDAIVLSADAETKTLQTRLPDGLVALYLEEDNGKDEEDE
jgi:16S rRNA processing protein RimM